MRGYGLPAVVAINAFPTDKPSEIEVVRRVGARRRARAMPWSADHFASGGAGAEELARAVWAVAGDGAPGFRFLSREDASLEERIERIATRVYGADGVDFSGEAAKQLAEFERLGYGHLPVCMAKTQLSLSHDPSLKGRPTGFRVPVRDARLFAGAGFVTAYCGEMLMMPGLPSRPSGEDVDINERGETVGLF